MVCSGIIVIFFYVDLFRVVKRYVKKVWIVLIKFIWKLCIEDMCDILLDMEIDSCKVSCIFFIFIFIIMCRIIIKLLDSCGGINLLMVLILNS